MINYALHTRLKGAIVLTDAFHADPALGRDRSLYKFIWVRSGKIVSNQVNEHPVPVQEIEW